jgi:hypothetical protein
MEMIEFFGLYFFISAVCCAVLFTTEAISTDHITTSRAAGFGLALALVCPILVGILTIQRLPLFSTGVSNDK